MDIIWLASYPKSGNTFLRLLLYRYIYANTLDTTQIEETIPDLHKVLSKQKKLNLELNGSILAKTHFLLSNQHPYYKNTAGFIYILRNPRDVLLSNARYAGCYKDQELLYSFAKSFIKNMGYDRWKNMGMGTYPQHFTSWLNSIPNFPHLFIKYEELRNNTVESLTNIINFLGIEADQERIKKVVQECDIDNVRKKEMEEKKMNKEAFFDNLPKGEYFVGKGNMNQSLANISEEVEEYYQQKFYNFVHLFGY